MEANCFSCKQLVEVKNPKKETTKNFRLRLSGECSKCGKQVSRFISDPDRPALSLDEKKARESKRREEKKKEKALNPEIKASIKKAKKRKIRIGDIELSITALEVDDDSVPKRRKLTLKEKREKEIRELKEKNEQLLEQLKGMQDEDRSEESESEETEKEAIEDESVTEMDQ